MDAVFGYTMQNTTSEKLEIHGENLLRDDEDFWYIKDVNIYYDPIHQYPRRYLKMKWMPICTIRMISYLFRANYTYGNKYIFTAHFPAGTVLQSSARTNGISNFPSFAAGWNVSEEEFMKNIPLISKLKLRGSWGMIGNEKIQFYDRYARTQDLLAVFGQQEASNPAVSYGASGNPDLTWESTKQTDVGLGNWPA